MLLKKLRDALEYLRGRLAGRNKEDVEKAISMVYPLFKKLHFMTKNQRSKLKIDLICCDRWKHWQ